MPESEYPSTDVSSLTLTTLYTHSAKTYKEMFEHSEMREGIIVWEGMLTRLITVDLNLSIPYYTSITRALKAMGCIRQLRRGGGTSPSLWALITEPTPELFRDIDPTLTRTGKGSSRHDQLQYQISQLTERVQSLEDLLENIIKEEA